ncbi:hypothetical protein K443DRAFT_4115 [Laccaria amethystina LaAM-08-1]|uniref:AB hydrolase-1 domain-containing protein n=1 Tax=Laccaria amethystina LaAM-08-1 TaxID=1095629 RepID=A0A0C9Y4Q6_9AGAR|nr:hypothetical protein K443DRAFT_4115 [Laccaria amethystina LaAM-08-1]
MTTEITGSVDFFVEGQIYQTWYKIVGDLMTGAHRPLVILHGGPGLDHGYVLPNALIYEKAGIPVVFYDQLGGGRSTHRPDAPKEFWTPELFMDELDNLLKHLHIQDDFDLLGHSWGGMLGAQYAASRSPKGLKRLIISNSPASMDLFEAGINALLEEFPADVVQKIRKHEADGTTHEQEYLSFMMTFYGKHVCKMDPMPEVLANSLKTMESEPTVYRTMQGLSEFSLTGTLKGWTIVDILHNISCPTLLLSAPLDEVQQPAVLPFFLKIQKIKWVEFQNSTHLACYDEPEKYFKVVLDFLEGTEGAN